MSYSAASLLRGRGNPIVIVSCTRPGRGRITTIRSARNTASSTSCVTISMVGRKSCHKASTSSCRLARVNASSAENGSSSSRIPGWPISARAIATRCCWPPDRSFGQRVAVAGQSDALQQRFAAAPPLRLVDAATAKCDVVGDAQPGQQPRFLEYRADRRMRAGDRLAVDCDRAGAGLIQPGDQPQQCGLAAAGAAEQRDDLAALRAQAACRAAPRCRQRRSCREPRSPAVVTAAPARCPASAAAAW